MTELYLGDLQAAIAELGNAVPDWLDEHQPKLAAAIDSVLEYHGIIGATPDTATSSSEVRNLNTSSAPWFENAAALLAEPDPGDTPFLVQDLIVDRSVAQLVGPPKKGKTYVLLDLATPSRPAARLSDASRCPNPAPCCSCSKSPGARRSTAGSTGSPAGAQSPLMH